jgi:hypothetical protein
MATFLVLNGVDIAATTDEQEQLILDVAAGRSRREDLSVWLRSHTTKLDSDSVAGAGISRHDRHHHAAGKPAVRALRIPPAQVLRAG